MEFNAKHAQDFLNHTLATVESIQVLNNSGQLCGRAGFTFNMVFHDGDQMPVRERFWQVFDLFCQTLPMKQMVWWWSGTPTPFLGKRAQKQLAELKMNAQRPTSAIFIKMASDNPAHKKNAEPFWGNHAQEYLIKTALQNTFFTWHKHNQYGCGPSMSMVRLGLPVAWIRNGGDTAGLIRRSVEIMQPFWATAGWGIIPSIDEPFNWGAGGAQRNLYPWLLRYPELDAINSLALTDPAFNRAMSSINWINYVSDPLLDQLGGREAVRARIDASQTLSCADVGNCLMIQAGAFPTLSDAKLNQLPLPGFGEAARLLKPIRAEGVLNGWISHDGASDPEDQNWQRDCAAWFSRFDQC